MNNAIDNAPLTRGDLREFCALLCEGLDPCERGDPVPAIMIKELHSDAMTEDNETRVRLYALFGDRTGVQFDDAPIRFAD